MSASAPGHNRVVNDERALARADFDHVTRVSTRWADNDMYGHLNNAVYYELFDSAINSWLIEGAGLDVMAIPELGVVAESGCRFYREVEYPQALDVAVRVERIGRSSITYRLGLFGAGVDEVAAVGHWVHVYIDRDSRSSVPIPPVVRTLMEAAERTRR